MKRHKPTDQLRGQVLAYSSVGMRFVDIAKKLSISDETLAKFYGDECHSGKLDACVNVARSLYELAVGGNVTAAIFWLKTQGRWRETSEETETAAVVTHNLRVVS